MQKLTFLLFIGLLSCNSQKKELKDNVLPKNTESEIVAKLSGKEIVTELDKLDFFNLTDKSELETVKQEFAESKDKWNFFSGKMRGETTDFTDNRFMTIDCEELFEAGGLEVYLKKVKNVFDKLELNFVYRNEESYQTENYWKHTININGVIYNAFDGSFSDNDWGISYSNFLIMVNDQLKHQNTDNSFYPINCANDGMIVLLTKKQFDFVKEHYPNDNEHPKELSEWMILNGL